MDLKNLIKEVNQISKVAGAEILNVYEASEDIGLEIKSDDSPLTKADRNANQVICAGLEKLVPKFPIISEENKLVSFEERSQYDYYWLVDPLDGTKEFVKRNGEFTVNIALIKDQMPVAGVVYVPVTGELFWRSKDKAPFRRKMVLFSNSLVHPFLCKILAWV